MGAVPLGEVKIQELDQVGTYMVDNMNRVGTICRQYYWEQYIGPLLAKIPIILLLLVLLDFLIFLFYYLS